MEDNWDPASRCENIMSSSTDHNISLDEALAEARRWVEGVTGKRFKYRDFRRSVADGVLFCELMRIIKDKSIRKINRLSTAFAGMDNSNVFLKACEKEFGLSGSQLFHAGDLQDLSHRASFSIPERRKEEERRLKNVCITLYWLGKSASKSESYTGPQLNLDVFTNLLFDGTASLKDTSSSGVSSMDSGDPTNSHRFSFGGCDEVFGADGALDFSNIAPSNYKEPEWKRSLSQDIEPETLITVQAIVPEETAPPSGEVLVESQSEEIKQQIVVAAVSRRRMERRRHPNALKPHMRSQSVPEQMLGPSSAGDDEEENPMWMSSLSSWKSKRIRATSTERSRAALQEEVSNIERSRRKSKTYREIVEDKEKREKELQEIYDAEHGTEGGPPTPDQVDKIELEKIMTDDVPTGYGSDGEQNNNRDAVVNSTGNGVMDTVDSAIVPQQADSQYSSAPSQRSTLPMSFHDKLIQEREQDHEMATERRDIHSKAKDINARKPRLSVGIMSRVKAFNRGEADVPKEETKPQKPTLMRERSMSRPFSEMTVCINQQARSERGFGFAVEGGIDQDKPIVVTQVESGGPADLSELRVKDEIFSINCEKVKPFTHDDFMYCISQAVLSGNLTLKVRRYDNEVSENQSSDPTEVISPSRARAMFSEMEQKRAAGALSPASSDSHSQRSLSPPQHHQKAPSHSILPSLENHKPNEEPYGGEDQLEEDNSVPYQDFKRLTQPVVDSATSPSTSPFSSPDEVDDRDKTWTEDKKSHHPPIHDDSPTHNVELTTAPSELDGKAPDVVNSGYEPKVKDDLDWLGNLEEFEQEAFGFIDAQGKKKGNDDENTKEIKEEIKMNKAEETLAKDVSHQPQQLSPREEERIENEIMTHLEKEEKAEQDEEARHTAIENDELDKSTIKEELIQPDHMQTVESSMPASEPSPPEPIEPPKPLFKVPTIVPVSNLGPKPYRSLAPEPYKTRVAEPYKRPAQPVFLREKDIREKVKADMQKRRSDFFTSPSSSGRSSPVDEPLHKSMEDLYVEHEPKETKSEESEQQQPVHHVEFRPRVELKKDSRPRSIHGMPARKTFNLEEERKRLERWQAEQERLRQEQYEQEQRRLQEQRERDLQRAQEEEKKRIEAEQRAIEERKKKLQQQAEERLRSAREVEEKQRLEQERLEQERLERKRLALEANEMNEQYPVEEQYATEEQYMSDYIDEVIQPQSNEEQFASMPREDPRETWQKEQAERDRLEQEREREALRAQEQKHEQLRKEREEQERRARVELEQLQKREREREELRAQEQKHEQLRKEREEQERRARVEREQLQKQKEAAERDNRTRLHDDEVERIRAEEREKLRQEWENLQRERAMQEEREKQEMERLKQLRAEQERLRQERMQLEKQQAEERRQLELEKERLRKLAAQPMPVAPASGVPPKDMHTNPFLAATAPIEHPNPFVEHTNPFHVGAGDAPPIDILHMTMPELGIPPPKPHKGDFLDPSQMSNLKRNTTQPQQHWLVEEAERRRLAEKAGTGRVSPFIKPKDTVDNTEPILEKKSHEPVESSAPPLPAPNAIGNGGQVKPNFPMDPPTRMAPPPGAGGDYGVPSHPYESQQQQQQQPVVRRPRRKEGDAEKQRKIQNRRSLPDMAGNNRGDVARTVGGEMTPPLGHGNAPPPEAIIQSLTQKAAARNPQMHSKSGKPGGPGSAFQQPSGKGPAPGRSVSGKLHCTNCKKALGRGAAMIIESLGLNYHVECFRCCVCSIQLGNGTAGTDVRIRSRRLHCQRCYSSDAGYEFTEV